MRFWARRFRHVTSAVVVVVALAALALPSTAMAEGESRVASDVVIPPTGTTYNDLGVAWWQYVLGQPAAGNPLSDPTGANCANGQSGPVFFLAGALGSGTAARDACKVSNRKQLFFPLVTAVDVHIPGDGLDTPKKVYREFQSFGFRADTLHASVDGVPVENLQPATTPYRACAAPTAGCTPSSFSITFPDKNLFDVPAGMYSPAVQDGYYLLLAPLKPGRHTITFGGNAYYGGAFSENITYRLQVVAAE